MEQERRRECSLPAERETALGDLGELGILRAAKKHVRSAAQAQRAGDWGPQSMALSHGVALERARAFGERADHASERRATAQRA